MANPFPFVAGEVLTAADMNGIGEYTTYTPTWTNLTVGNGTVTFRYGRVQNFIHVIGHIVFGSTTSITGSGVQVSLPVTAESPTNLQPVGLNVLNSPTLQFFGFQRLDTTTSAAIRVWNTSGTYLQSSSISATTPFTWATNDVITLNFIYEAA